MPTEVHYKGKIRFVQDKSSCFYAGVRDSTTSEYYQQYDGKEWQTVGVTRMKDGAVQSEE